MGERVTFRRICRRTDEPGPEYPTLEDARRDAKRHDHLSPECSPARVERVTRTTVETITTEVLPDAD